MTFLQGCALFFAAVLGGTLNSVAGGGSFITFPTLIFTRVPPIFANATSAVALWPGSVASASAYRSALVVERRVVVLLIGVSVVGGALGAALLLHTPQATFVRLVPYLLLLATILFAAGGRLTTFLRSRVGAGKVPPWLSLSGTALLQLVIASYGGFFGGGIGILMLAMLALTGREDIHAMNALKNLLASCINGVADIAFIVAGAVFWPQAVVMIVGGIIGGYGGSYVARRLDPLLVRRFVIAVGLGMSLYFFIRR